MFHRDASAPVLESLKVANWPTVITKFSPTAWTGRTIIARPGKSEVAASPSLPEIGSTFYSNPATIIRELQTAVRKTGPRQRPKGAERNRGKTPGEALDVDAGADRVRREAPCFRGRGGPEKRGQRPRLQKRPDFCPSYFVSC